MKHVTATQRTWGHPRVDAEIQRCLSEGWDPGTLHVQNSLKSYSSFLYTEVAVGFLYERVEAERARQKAILSEISGN